MSRQIAHWEGGKHCVEINQRTAVKQENIHNFVAFRCDENCYGTSSVDALESCIY